MDASRTAWGVILVKFLGSAGAFPGILFTSLPVTGGAALFHPVIYRHGADQTRRRALGALLLCKRGRQRDRSLSP